MLARPSRLSGVTRSRSPKHLESPISSAPSGPLLPGARGHRPHEKTIQGGIRPTASGSLATVQPYGPGYAAPGPAHPPPAQPPTGGRKVVLGISLAVLAFSLLLVLGTIIAGISSESLGVTMSYVTAGPLGFGLAATLMALMTKKSQSNGAAIGAPIGCGCFSAIFFAVMTFVFFVSIFPSL